MITLSDTWVPPVNDTAVQAAEITRSLIREAFSQIVMTSVQAEIIFLFIGLGLGIGFSYVTFRVWRKANALVE